MTPLRLALAAVSLIALGAPALAEPSFLPPPRPSPSPYGAAARHATPDEPPPATFEIGIAGGAAPFVHDPDPLVPETTPSTTVDLFARLRLPRISPRELELYTVLGHGLGLNLANEDLSFGGVHLHLLDVGVFYDLGSPVSVQRVARSWDLTLGLGATIDLSEQYVVSLDWRMFVPLDVWSVVTHYGDSSRLIGEEVLAGGQVSVGMARRF